MDQNLQYCLERQALALGEVTWLIKELSNQSDVATLSKEFTVSTSQMALYCLDAGLAFMRLAVYIYEEQLTRIGMFQPESGAFLLAPPPVARAGWRVMADPSISSFYERLCTKLCQLAGCEPFVLPYTEAVESGDYMIVEMTTIALTLAKIPYTPGHWPEISDPLGDRSRSYGPYGVGFL